MNRDMRYQLQPTTKQYVFALIFAMFTGAIWGFCVGFITHWSLSP